MHQLLLACGMCSTARGKLGPSYILTNPTDESPRDHCGGGATRVFLMSGWVIITLSS